MPKPTTLPVWNTSAGNRVAPSGGKQASGYSLGDIPVSGNLNWWKNLVYQWVLWLDGILTADGGVTALANQDITVSGTGAYNHGDITVNLPPSALSGSGGALTGTTSPYWLTSGSGAARCALPFLKPGDRIKSYAFQRYGDGSADITACDILLFNDALDPTVSTGVEASSVSNPSAAWALHAVNVDPDVTLVTGDAADFYLSYNAANIRIGKITITYDHPG